MDFRTELLQLLLVGDTEVLFLIYDDETKISKLHLLAEKCVCANNDIDIAACQAFSRIRHILRAYETRHLAQFYRQTMETLGESPVVLASKERRRHHDGDLIACHCSNEGRAKRDFRLAETNIAADKTIHRAAACEIFQNGLNCLLLVFRFGEGKACAELIIEPGVGSIAGADFNSRAAAIRISSAAISRMRSLRRAFLACQPVPPSLSSCASLSSAP